jgi:uncharacterized protein YecT (DUF1311 family)
MRPYSIFWIALVAASPGATRTADTLDREVERAFSASYNSCTKSASNIPEFGDCALHETKVQDARLNRVYREAMARLPQSKRNKLRFAERAWIRRRDPVCKDFSVKADGSAFTSMSVLIYLECRLKATTRRRILIERYEAGQASLANLVSDHRI